jgi:hypothetical protein
MTKIKTKIYIIIIIITYNFFSSLFWGGPWLTPAPPPSVIDHVTLIMLWLFKSLFDQNSIIINIQSQGQW